MGIIVSLFPSTTTPNRTKYDELLSGPALLRPLGFRVLLVSRSVLSVAMNLAIIGVMGMAILRIYSSRPAASVRYPETAICFAKQGREMPFATSSNERTY